MKAWANSTNRRVIPPRFIISPASMKNGKAIRFKETDARPLGRVSRGVRGVRLVGDDEVVTVEIVDTESTMMAITENGYGKRTNFDEYRCQTRGGKGIISIQTTDRNGKVVAPLDERPRVHHVVLDEVHLDRIRVVRVVRSDRVELRDALELCYGDAAVDAGSGEACGERRLDGADPAPLDAGGDGADQPATPGKPTRYGLGCDTSPGGGWAWLVGLLGVRAARRRR